MSVIVPVLIGGIFCYSGAFAEHTGPGVYNNEDLEKYNTPGSTVVEPPPDVRDAISNENKSEELKTREEEKPVPPEIRPHQDEFRGKEGNQRYPR